MPCGSKTKKYNKGGKVSPWNSKNPKPKGKGKKLTSKQKTEAKAKAKKAGRPYPNLVDNMAVSKKKK